MIICGASIYKVGDRIQVRPEFAHGDATGPGTIEEIYQGVAIAVRLDKMPDMIHRWYVDREVEPSTAPSHGSPM